MNSGVFYGDAERVLKTLPPGIVQCCVTSPPYWGLRDYSVAGQFGLEKTPDEYIARMVAVFREVWRALRDDGTVWLNLGDSYCSAGKGGEWDEGRTQKGTGQTLYSRQANRGNYSGLKPKDLCMIPARVALALQADGWWVRSDVIEEVQLYCPCGCGYVLEERIWRHAQDREIIWSKPNPMPESCTDRPTKSHEYMFLLSKSGSSKFWTHRDGAGARSKPKADYRWRHKETGEEVGIDPGDKDNWQRFNLWRGHDYFYDADAIREEAGPIKTAGENNNCDHPHTPDPRKKQDALGKNTYTGFNARWADSPRAGRNKRTVWEIPTMPYPGAHFATFPPKLVEPCILAGTSPRACEICGAPWKRVTAKGEPDEEWKASCGADSSGEYHGTAQKDYATAGAENPSEVKARILEGMRKRETVGWQPTCSCDNEGKGRCLVLDPFAGSGTTGEVALKHGRDYLLIELNRDYEKLIRGRLGLFYEEAEAAVVN